jgi:predicted transcriptional regulator
MKKTIKVLGAVFIVFIIAVCGLLFWQRHNLMSLLTATQYSSDEIAEKIESNKTAVKQQLNAFMQDDIIELTHEDEERIRRGEVSAEQVFEEIKAKNDTAENDAKSPVAKSIEQLYKVKATYIGKLGELERRAIADYKSLSKEKRGLAGQKYIISKYIKEAADLEKECDGIVDGILNYLKQELESTGEDTQIIKNIKKAYEDEKVLKKSYYLNSYRQ